MVYITIVEMSIASYSLKGGRKWVMGQQQKAHAVTNHIMGVAAAAEKCDIHGYFHLFFISLIFGD